MRCVRRVLVSTAVSVPDCSRCCNRAAGMPRCRREKTGNRQPREGQTLARDSAEGIAVKPGNGGGIDAQKAFAVLREPAQRQGVYIGNGFSPSER